MLDFDYHIRFYATNAASSGSEDVVSRPVLYLVPVHSLKERNRIKISKKVLVHNVYLGQGRQIIFYLHYLYRRHAYEEMVASDSFLAGIVIGLAWVCRIDFDLEHEVR